MTLNRVTVIGLGLMGGSLALALRRAGLAAHIVGCGREERLRQAREMCVIDSGSVDAGESVRGSDFVFFCTPVETSIKLLKQVAPRLKPGALVTDVGSTKQAFAAAARETFGSAANERVLPGHPLAGREVSGLAHASADLYKGCRWVLTPLAGEMLPVHRCLISALETIGAHIIFSTPEEHDHTLAYTSHLPQLLSTALSLTLRKTFGSGNPALQAHAGGLRTMLRLAESDPVMWEQIADSNQANIAEALENIEAELRELRGCLTSPEFRTKFELAREFTKGLKS
ncbi:MAG: prephenate dehydrogenase/arogenate dehydrogenase family protein [Acidobacteria bacterium]|nr:MAG: prephenate dehydrogenase/arogenate dehydrogenase family protein [Acidobacteriota bacterium]